MNEHTSPEASELVEAPVRIYKTDADEIAKAVCAVMQEVKRLKKDADNAFANYKYVSVDDFKDALRPLLADNGLTVCMSQTGMDRFPFKDSKGKESTHCQFDFEIWLEHTTGQKGEREGSTVCLPYTGAQTTGQARSYAQKEYLKSRFLQSTGDLAEDADNYGLEVKFTKDQARELHKQLMDDLKGFQKQGSMADLSDWRAKHKVLIEACPDDWIVYIKSEFEVARIEIKKRAATERAKEAQPADIDRYLSDLEARLLEAPDRAAVAEIWAEAEVFVNVLPDPEQGRANAALDAAEDRLGLL